MADVSAEMIPSAYAALGSSFIILNRNNLLQNSISFTLFDEPKGETLPMEIKSVLSHDHFGQIIGSIAVFRVEITVAEGSSCISSPQSSARW